MNNLYNPNIALEYASNWNTSNLDQDLFQVPNWHVRNLVQPVYNPNIGLIPAFNWNVTNLDMGGDG